MKDKFFRNVRCNGDWEFSLFLGPLQVRIGRSQFAVWWMKRRYEFLSLVDLQYGYARAR